MFRSKGLQDFVGISFKRVGSAAVVLLLGSSCADAGDQEKWGSGFGPDFCSASRESDDEPLSITLRRPSGSGLNVHASIFENLTLDREYPEITLAIDGKTIRARAFGAQFRDKPGVGFAFNALQMLNRHPDGFTVSVRQGGREIYETKVGAPALKALEELKECDRNRMLGVEPPIPYS